MLTGIVVVESEVVVVVVNLGCLDEVEFESLFAVMGQPIDFLVVVKQYLWNL